MRMRNKIQLERELIGYKYLCLFILGLCIGYYIGGAM